jgi:Matrixin
MHLRVRLAICGVLALASSMGVVSSAGAAPIAHAGDGALAPGVPDRSIFSDDRLRGSGWAACPDPIRWSLDTGDLPAGLSASVAADVTWALQTWGRGSGLTFVRDRVTRHAYDDVTHTAVPADGNRRSRHLYVSFVADAQSDYLGGSVVGVGAPTRVLPDTREIIAGSAVFLSDFAARASRPERVAVILHELGHALGLAHSDGDGDVMRPLVARTRTLSPADVAGVRSLIRPCER